MNEQREKSCRFHDWAVPFPSSATEKTIEDEIEMMPINGVTLFEASRWGTVTLWLVLIISTAANSGAAQDAKNAREQSACQPRGTLFQWSYGNSFSGGPRLDEPLVTDRPDFTEASVTVGRDVTQIEMGYVYVNDRGPGTSSDGHAYPDFLLRQGLFADWLELRVGWTYLSERETAGSITTTSHRSSDLLLATKIALTPQEGALPEMALAPQLLVPVSDDPILGGGEVLPGVNWMYSWGLNDRISTGGSSQLIRALDDETEEPYLLIAQSWVVGLSITDSLGAYTEWFALIPDGADTNQTLHFLNGGFTYLVNDNLQLDIRAGVGLNDAADDFFVGTGLSIRFP